MSQSDNGRTLVLKRVFDAPPEAVFKAWTTPELLMKWYTPKPYETVAADLDVRVGGGCNITMRSPEGQDMPNPGIYLEVVPNRRLVFTDAFTEGWVPGLEAPFMVGTIELEPLPGGRTAYTATARHWSVEATKRHDEMGFHAGWGAAADQLAEVLAAMKADAADETSAVDLGVADGVVPYLSIDGASEAAAFYAKAFGAEELMRMPGVDGTRLLHCQLKINGGSLMIADVFPEMGFPPIQRSDSYTMQLVVADGDMWWNRAVAAGCTVEMPFEVAFWGDRYGRLRDPFGVGWALTEPAKVG